MALGRITNAYTSLSVSSRGPGGWPWGRITNSYTSLSVSRPGPVSNWPRAGSLMPTLLFPFRVVILEVIGLGQDH